MIGRHRCALPGPLYFPAGPTPARRKRVRIDQYADAHECEAGPCTDGWYQLLPQLLARLAQEASPDYSLLRKGVTFAFTPAMKELVRETLAELPTPQIVVFSSWDAVADGSRPFHVYCDACVDGFGAALEQEQTAP